MDNPAVSEILTAGLVLVSLYVAKNEYEQLKEFFPNSVSPPKKKLLPSSVDTYALDDADNKKYGTPQEQIYNNTTPGNWPNFGSWGPGCHEQYGPGTQNLGSKVYCMCYNNGKYTAPANGQFPPTITGPVNSWPSKTPPWPNNGFFYSQNTPPIHVDSPRWLYPTGGMPVNPAFYSFYLYNTWEIIKSKFTKSSQ